MKPQITLGTDFEVFLFDKKFNTPIPACGLLGGTKKNPRQIPGAPRGYMMQEDNIMAELNTPPKRSVDTFLLSVHKVGILFEQFLAASYPYLYYKPLPYIDIPREILNLEGAQMVGCDPDYSAYEGGTKRPSFGFEDLGDSRYAGGHIWIGVPKCDVPTEVFVLLLDAFFTLPLLGRDLQGKRRALYGKAGLFRQRETNTQRLIEYRTPSNFWVLPNNRAHVEYYLSWAIRQIQLAISKPESMQQWFKQVSWAEVQFCIDRELEARGKRLFDNLASSLKEV